jgi:hypothetical protein
LPLAIAGSLENGSFHSDPKPSAKDHHVVVACRCALPHLESVKEDILRRLDAAANTVLAAEITDKRGYGARYLFSPRHVDNLIAQGLLHLKIGKRRVRIIISEADAWMKERFGTRRLGPIEPSTTKRRLGRKSCCSVEAQTDGGGGG